MSKAEKFISDCTRNCSNLVYKDSINGKEFNTYNYWLTPDDARKAVEIAREEMMEKAVDAELYSDGMLTPIIKVSDKEKISNIKFGDKLKLIIIKDEEEI